MKNDPRAYLSRMGLPKGVSKADELNAKSAASGRIPVKAHDRSKPMPNKRSLGIDCDSMNVSGSTHGKGSLGSMSDDKKGHAKSTNIEGNESAKYERMERKSMKGLKGSPEKVLRRGHNDSGKVGKVMSEFKHGKLHSGSKKGPKVTNRKQAIAIGMSEARKAAKGGY